MRLSRFLAPALSRSAILHQFHSPRYERTLTARAATMTSVNSEIALSSIISIFARLVEAMPGI